MTKYRSAAKSKNQKNQFKLIVNSLFGKFLQNNEKFIDTVVHRSAISLRQAINSPYFISSMEIGPDLYLSFHRQKSIVINKPVLMGLQVLELSKRFMYAIYYGHLNKLSRPNLLMSDTDSFIFQLKSADVESEFEKINEIMVS